MKINYLLIYKKKNSIIFTFKNIFFTFFFKNKINDLEIFNY